MKKELVKLSKKAIAFVLTFLMVVSLIFVTAYATSDEKISSDGKTDIYDDIEQEKDTSHDTPAEESVIHEFNGHYYKIIQTMECSWERAQEECEKAGGYLACVTSAEEQAFLERINTESLCLWLGGQLSSDGNWCWVNGESFEYANWYEGEPSGGYENSISMWPAQWNDLSHDNLWEQSGYICEWNSAEDIELSPEKPTEPTEETKETDYIGELQPVDVVAKGTVYEYNNHYYSVYYVSGYDWEEAREYCQSAGGYLAVITDANEQAFVEKVNSISERVWIGGYRDNQFNWYWVNGEEWDYTNWMEGEPNDSDNVISNENRLTLWPTLWNDINEENTIEQNGFVCEWDDVEYMTGIDAPSDNNHDDDSSDNKPVDTDPTEPEKPAETTPVECQHKWITTTEAISPSCTEEGEKVYSCYTCGETKTVTVPAIGHIIKVEGKKNATYFEKGHTGKEVCMVCGEVISKGKAVAKLKLNVPSVKYQGGKKKFTVKYSKVTGATAFQIKYKLNKKTETKTYKTKKNMNVTINKLKKGNYSVQVRAVLEKGKKTVYSDWSKAKKVKVKK